MKDKASRWLLYASYMLPPCLAFASFRQWRLVAQLQRLKLAEENLNRVMEKVRREVLSDK
ncbi:hypothetical protein RchiOBHm_Chr3g0454171 [Rosa chinensis]|uniref:Uncharacterized protein n=1 Tax=Rosa chinensis TaxID=74649 RepID=A0A2P6R6S7_ROSCH|nr:hypothetical protein RchiOBHm_Chr3g0454171 [Rosa chinensis]